MDFDFIFARREDAVSNAKEQIRHFKTKEQIEEVKSISVLLKSAQDGLALVMDDEACANQYMAYIAMIESVANDRILKEKTERLERSYFSPVSNAAHELMLSSGYPERHSTLRFIDWLAHTDEQLSVIRNVEAWANEQAEALSGRCVFLYGPPGTGKTHLACSAGLHVIRMAMYRARVVYSTAADIVRTVRSSYDTESGLTESDAFRRFTEPSILIMDEVGVGKDSDFSRETLHTVISRRYDKKKPTIFLTNSNSKDFRAAIMERAWDRLQEDRPLILKMQWESFRSSPRTGDSLFIPKFRAVTQEDFHE